MFHTPQILICCNNICVVVRKYTDILIFIISHMFFSPFISFTHQVTSYFILSSYHIVSHDLISYHIKSYLVIQHNIIQYHIISYHIISYHIIQYHIISYHIIQYHIISYHTIPYHITSYHTISYLAKRCQFHSFSCLW